MESRDSAATPASTKARSVRPTVGAHSSTDPPEETALRARHWWCAERGQYRGEPVISPELRQRRLADRARVVQGGRWWYSKRHTSVRSTRLYPTAVIGTSSRSRRSANDTAVLSVQVMNTAGGCPVVLTAAHAQLRAGW